MVCDPPDMICCDPERLADLSRCVQSIGRLRQRNDLLSFALFRRKPLLDCFCANVNGLKRLPDPCIAHLGRRLTHEVRIEFRRTASIALERKVPAEGHADIVSFRLVIFPRSGIGEANRFSGRNAAFRLLLAPDRQPRAGAAAVIPQELCAQKIGTPFRFRRLAAHQQHVRQ